MSPVSFQPDSKKKPLRSNENVIKTFYSLTNPNTKKKDCCLWGTRFKWECGPYSTGMSTLNVSHENGSLLLIVLVINNSTLLAPPPTVHYVSSRYKFGLPFSLKVPTKSIPMLT